MGLNIKLPFKEQKAQGKKLEKEHKSNTRKWTTSESKFIPRTKAQGYW